MKKRAKAAAADVRAAPDDWQFWDGEVTPLAEERTREAQLLKTQDSVRRAKGGAARGDQYIERNRDIHDMDIAGKSAHVIAKKYKLSPSRVRTILRKPRP